MNDFHFKYGQCENCGLATKEVGPLQVVNFWKEINSRLTPYYLYVCDNCFESRKAWCKNLFPDSCEKCNEIIEDGEHYLEKVVNKDNKSIQSYGLTEDEKCKIICYECQKT